MADGYKKKEVKEDEFHRLLFRNQNRIYSYILALVGNYNDADDVMQETISVMWRKFNDFRSGTDFVAWGITIARFKVLDYRRIKRKDGKVYQYTNEFFDKFEHNVAENDKYFEAKFDSLKKCIHNLKGQYQMVIKLRFKENLNPLSISNRCDMNVSNVYKILSRAYQMLLACMSHQGFNK